MTVGMGYSHSSVFYPAVVLKDKPKPKHPVLLVPGLLTSKLESWSILKDSCEGRLGKYFRTPVWTKMTGILRWFLNGQCILDYMDVDTKEGRDSPKGYRVRAATGFEAVDYFIGGYSIWAHVLGNLAAIGYDPSTMSMVPFDWRLGFNMLEERDGTFTRMKTEVELLSKKSKEKVVVVTHSMGGNMFLYFMQWVQHEDPNWFDKYIQSWVSNGTPFLGNVRGISAVLTGYVKESASGQIKYLMDLAMDPNKRQQTMSHLRSYYAILPMGGNRIWGNKTYNPMLANPNVNASEMAGGQILTIFENGESRGAITADDLQGHILDKLHPDLQAFARSLNLKGGTVQEDDKGSWANPLASQLPKGNFSIYCMYGVDVPTDLSYSIKETATRYDIDVNVKKMGYANGGYSLNGDETVPLTSLGYTCQSTWRHNPKYNPHNISIIIKEYPDSKNNSATHVDLLHHPQFLTDLISIVTGHHVKEEIHSNLTKIVQNIDSQPNE